MTRISPQLSLHPIFFSLVREIFLRSISYWSALGSYEWQLLKNLRGCTRLFVRSYLCFFTSKSHPWIFSTFPFFVSLSPSIYVWMKFFQMYFWSQPTTHHHQYLTLTKSNLKLISLWPSPFLLQKYSKILQISSILLCPTFSLLHRFVIYLLVIALYCPSLYESSFFSPRTLHLLIILRQKPNVEIVN